MLLRILVVIGTLAIVGMAVPGLNLYLAHQQINQLNPALPSLQEIRQTTRGRGRPVSIEVFNTASQMLPVSLVLEDAEPGVMFEMSFPVFVVSWADGRRFLIDTGLTESTVEDFGQPSEILGAEPIQFHAGLKDLIDIGSIDAVGFTHLHSDHVDGISDLCPVSETFYIIQSVEQYAVSNYTTSGGKLQLDQLACGQRLLIKEDSPLKSIGGFPGIYLVNAAGHTPGSQVFIVNILNAGRSLTYVLAGDMVNHFRGIEENTGKPAWYSYLFVPENGQQLERARLWLKELDRQTDISVLVSHHKSNIDAALVN